MPFEALNLREELSVHNIVTIHYFEYMNTFDFLESPMTSGSLCV